MIFPRPFFIIRAYELLSHCPVRDRGTYAIDPVRVNCVCPVNIPPDAAGNCVHSGNNAAGAGVQKKYKAFLFC